MRDAVTAGWISENRHIFLSRRLMFMISRALYARILRLPTDGRSV